MIPRVVIAGTSSGAGKTTVACGLIGALRASGRAVQAFKVGPDYIDPTYHTLASGRPGRNLDSFLSGPELVAPLFRHGCDGAEIAVIEGVMGLFDGANGRGELASTAQIAKALQAPVVLVLDARSLARSAAAIIHGFRSFDPEVKIAGVVFNQVGSESHGELLRAAVAGLDDPPVVLGTLPRHVAVSWPERHLGLVPAGERKPQVARALTTLTKLITGELDLDAIVRLAAGAPDVPGPKFSPAEVMRNSTLTAPASPRIAVATGPAFCFHYQENLELLAATGAELVEFDPIVDEALPVGASGLILAGGFPEVFAESLATNRPLLADVRAFAERGGPIYAECGGLLYLSRSLDTHQLCGVLPINARMTGRLTLGYRQATALAATDWIAAGDSVNGHEFHYSQTEIDDRPSVNPAWSFASSAGRELGRDGVVSGRVQASYLHLQWAAYPEIPASFAASAARLER